MRDLCFGEGARTPLARDYRRHALGSNAVDNKLEDAGRGPRYVRQLLFARSGLDFAGQQSDSTDRAAPNHLSPLAPPMFVPGP